MILLAGELIAIGILVLVWRAGVAGSMMSAIKLARYLRLPTYPEAFASNYPYVLGSALILSGVGLCVAFAFGVR